MTKRILIIDDEQDLREIVQMALEDFTDWQTETAGSGQEGLQKAMTTAFDAILLDVSMPDFSGLQVFEKLQSHPHTQQVPVIFLTARVRARELTEFGQIGIVGVITKPFNPTTIAHRIAEILDWPLS